MINQEGKIYYGLGLDNDQLQADANQSMAIIRGIGDSSVAEGARIDNAYKKIAGSVAAIFTIQKAAEFAKSIIQVRGEIESLEISFETLLGSKEKADALFGEIRTFASNTPMELAPLAKGAQTLLSFNVEAEKVMPILRQIGDISMGNSDKFNSLVLAFAQMSSTGKLMGQDLLQMINAGFNPLTVIADKTGKSISQLKDEMSAGAITVDMVTDAFASAASEGGQFYGMLEKQSKGINGSISNLKGAIDDMFNDLGTKSQGFITTAIGGATELVKHYETIGEILAVIVATYGTYKAAIIATEAVRQSLNTIRYAEEATQLTQLLTVEQQARISKLGLTQGSLQHSAAVKAEVASNVQAAQATLAKARTEVSAASQVVAARRAEYIAAKQLDQQRLAELMSIGATGTAKQVETAQRRLAAAQTQKESAAIAFQNATRDFSTKKMAVETAARQANTITTAANTAAQTANVTATNILTAAKLRLTAMAAKLNAVIMANPYMLAAAAVVALVYGIYKLVTAETAAEAAQRKHNEAMEAAREKKENLISKTQQLINKINDETQTIYSQIKAWKELQKEMPEAFANMSMQEFKNMKPEDREKLINKTADDNEIAEFNKALTEAERRVESLKKSINDAATMPSGQFGNGSLIWALSRQLNEAEETLRLKKQEKVQRDEIIRQAEFEAKTDEEKVAILNEQLKKYQDQYAEIEKLVPETERVAGAMNTSVTPAISNVEKGLFDLNYEWGKFDWQTQLNLSHLDFINGKINEINSTIAGITTANGQGITYAQAKATAKKDYENAKKLLDDITKSSKASQKEYEDAVTDLEKKKKAYQALGGETTTKPKTSRRDSAKEEAARIQRETADRKQKIEDYTKEVKRQIKQSELDIAQSRIDAMDDSFDKEQKQIQLTYDRMIFANQQREEEMVKALQDARELAWENDNPKAKKDGKTFDRSTVTADDLSPEQKKALEEYTSVANKIKEKSEADLLKKLLEQYRTFEQKRTDINKQFDEERKAIENSSISQTAKDTALSELELKRKEAIKSVNDDEVASMQKSSQLLVKLFEEASNKSVKELLKISETAEDLLSYLANTSSEDITPNFGFTAEQLKALKESPKDLEAIKKAIKELNDAGIQKNPFAVLVHNLKEVFKAGKSDDTTEKKLAELGESAAASADIIGDLAGKFAEMFEAAGNDSAAEAMDTVQGVMTSVSNIGQGFAKGGIIGGIGAAVGEVASWATKAFQAAAAHRAALEAIQKEIVAQERMNYLLDLQNQLEGKRFTTIFGVDQYGKALNAIDVYEKALDKLNETLTGTEQQKNKGKSFFANLLKVEDANAALKEIYAGLADIEIVTGHKKTGLFGWGKGKDTYSSVLDVYPELIKADGEFNKQLAETVLATRRMSDEDKASLQNMINLFEQYEEAMQQVRDYLTSIFGELGNSMSDALVDAFKNGTDAAEAFKKTVSEMLETLAQQMIYSVTLAPIMEKAQEQMLEIMKNGDLTDAQKFAQYAQVLSNVTDEAIAQQNYANDLMKMYQEMAAQKGIDIFNPTDEKRETSSKGFASMNQDSADELNGRFTALQALTYEICMSIKVLLSNSQSILLVVTGIKEDTKSLSRLENIEKDITSVKNSMNDINLKGITIKK